MTHCSKRMQHVCSLVRIRLIANVCPSYFKGTRDWRQYDRSQRPVKLAIMMTAQPVNSPISSRFMFIPFFPNSVSSWVGGSGRVWEVPGSSGVWLLANQGSGCQKVLGEVQVEVQKVPGDLWISKRIAGCSIFFVQKDVLSDGSPDAELHADPAEVQLQRDRTDPGPWRV